MIRNMSFTLAAFLIQSQKELCRVALEVRVVRNAGENSALENPGTN
jgi:hypothetical protein